MKKLVSILVLLTIVLAGCGTPTTPAATQPVAQPPAAGEPTTAPTTAEIPQAQRTLHVFAPSQQAQVEAAWEEVAKDFEKEFGVKVDIRWQGKWSELAQNLEAARMAKEPIDITYSTGTLLAPTLARSGMLMDITELVKPYQDRFTTGMLDFYTLGGKVWGVPVGAASTSMIFYNADMFAELGLQEPKTLEEWLNVLSVIREKKGIEPMIHQGKAPWYWPMWFFETYAQTSGNKSNEMLGSFLKGERQFTSAEEVAAFDALAAIGKDKILDPSVLDVDGDGMRAAFAQQKTAMFYGGLWELSSLQTIVGDNFKIGIFEFPLMVNTPGVVPQHGGGPDDAWSIPSFAPPENIDIQAQYLEFITRPEEAGKVIAAYVPYIPTIKGVKPVDDPLAAKMNAEFLPHTIPFLDWTWPTEINDVMTQVIPAVMFGNMTSAEAAQQVQDAYDQVVTEKDYKYNWWDSWSEADWQKVTPSSIPQIVVK